MPLSYNNNVPQGSQTVASTQSPILVNFQSIDTTCNNVNTGGNFTQYATQGVAAALSGGTLPADPVGIFHSVNGANAMLNHPIPYYANSQGDFPLLPDLKTSGTNFGFKIGSIIFNFGTVTIVASNTGTATFAIAFTSGTSYGMSVFPTSGSSLTEGQWSFSPAAGSAVVRRGSNTVGTISFTYVAIGT